MNSKEEVKKLNLQGIEIELPFPVVVEEDIVSLSSVLKKEFEIIKQSLDRLEQLEKERQEVETRLSSKETNTFDEIATMIKKANDYDVLVNKCKQLEKENQELKDDNSQMQGWYDCYFIENEKLEKENTKLKKALDILKNGFEVILCENNFPISEIKYSIGFKFNNEGVWIHISQEEYELLKSVLEEE